MKRLLLTIALLLVLTLTGCTFTKEYEGIISHTTYSESILGSSTTVYFANGTSTRFSGKTDNIVEGKRYRLTIKITPTNEELVKIEELNK